MIESPIILPNKLPDNICPFRGFFPMLDQQGRVVGAVEGPCIDRRCKFWLNYTEDTGVCKILEVVNCHLPVESRGK